jgi:hypothetical protein
MMRSKELASLQTQAFYTAEELRSKSQSEILKLWFELQSSTATITDTRGRPVRTARFDGSTYDYNRDHNRLENQLQQVREYLEDGVPSGLQEISRYTRIPMQSVSARIRDLRKPKFGGYTIVRTHVYGGYFHYAMLLDDETGEPIRNAPDHESAKVSERD